MTNVLITGGNGMLGAALARIASAGSRFNARAVSHGELDVRDNDSVQRWADWVEGGWIVHCAAMVDVKACARIPAEARETIVTGTANMAALAKQANARILYPQSFLIYEGGPGLIEESTSPAPLSLYGQLKWEAEQLLHEHLDDPLIVRMAGFFGGEERDKNFVGQIIPVLQRAMVEGKPTFDVGDRVWQPTWTDDLAFNTLHLMESNCSGVYQMGAKGEATFFDVAEQIVQSLGWDDRLRITQVDAAAVAATEVGPERRPTRAVLACSRLKAEHRDLQRDWRSSLNAYLSTPYFDQYRSRK